MAWSKKHEYMYREGALVKRPSGRTDEELSEISSAMKAPRGHVPKREVYNHPHKVDTDNDDIGEYSKDKYWVHKDKSWDLKPCKRHPFDLRRKR